MHKLLIPTSKHLEDIPNKTFISLLHALEREAAGKFEVIIKDENECESLLNDNIDFVILIRGVGWNTKFKNATTVVFWDDLHWTTERKRQARHNLFHTSDIILLPYYNNFVKIQEYQKYKSRALWCPFFAPDDALQYKKKWSDRIAKIFVSGRCTDHYPLRQKIRNHALQNPDKFYVLDHPGYKNLSHQIVGNSFYDLLGSYSAAVVTSASCPLNYTVAKYFEVPACGCIPFMEELHELNDLGFEAWKNYIPVSELTFKINFNPSNISKKMIGMESGKLIKQNHTATLRARYILNILQTGKLNHWYTKKDWDD